MFRTLTRSLNRLMQSWSTLKNFIRKKSCSQFWKKYPCLLSYRSSMKNWSTFFIFNKKKKANSSFMRFTSQYCNWQPHLHVLLLASPKRTMTHWLVSSGDGSLLSIITPIIKKALKKLNIIKYRIRNIRQALLKKNFWI